MTKEITKAYIIQEIEDKLKLRELEPERFAFSELVIPTYDIEPHLKKQICEFEEVNMTGLGGRVFFTVPDTERWFVSAYNVIFMGAGAITVSGVYVTRRGYTSKFTYLDLTAAQTVSYAVNLPKPLVLDWGDRLSINIDGYTSSQDLRLYIDYASEETR